MSFFCCGYYEPIDNERNQLFESARELMGLHESLRPNEIKSGREFKLFKIPRELMRVHECLRPNESESGREFKPFEIA